MKERIVIEADEKICKGCDTCLQEPRMVAICNLKNNLDIDLKKEQVPETWEELKELCKGMYADITEHSITLFGCLEFWDDGKLSFFHYSDIVNNLTPTQIWQIIKNLIGE